MAAIEKGARVLEVLHGADSPMTFADLTKACGFPKSSMHDTCTSLTGTGLIERLGDGRYRLGIRLVELGQKRLSESDVVEHFHAACQDLGALADETIVLAIRNGIDTLYLGRRHGNKPIAVRYQKVGMRLPAALTGTGKALLSMETDDDVRALYRDGQGLTSPFGTATKTLDGLLAELAEVRVSSLAVDEEEAVPGMLCIAAPIRSAHPGDLPEERAAVGFSVVRATVGDAARAELGSQILRLADAIALRMSMA